MLQLGRASLATVALTVYDWLAEHINYVVGVRVCGAFVRWPCIINKF